MAVASNVSGDTGSGPGPEEPTPLDSIMAPVNRARGIRGLPGITRTAIRVVHSAAPRTLLSTIALQVISAALVGAQLYVVKGLVTGLVRLARDADATISEITPSFAGLLLVTFLLGLVAAVTEQQTRMLSEHVTRWTTDRIIDVASSVPLSKFEEPTFYDHLERATAAGMLRPVGMVNSLLALVLGVLTSVGILIALATMELLLVPLVILAGVPILLATLQNSRQSYVFEYAMTTHSRERLHLLELFTERESAKELRVFSAIRFLRRRYDALSDERISRMREFLRRRLTVSLLGTLASAVGTGIALGSLVWLISTERTGIATAAAAAIAMQVLASRLSSVTAALGKLVESGMFLDDMQAFFELDETQPAHAHGRTAAPAFETLRAEHLTFTYPGTSSAVLQDVSLEIRRGEVVAVVGENGSGKTTLVKLLCQLYDAQSGCITWNGRDTRELEEDALRSRMTVLFQDFVRYHLTAADNISLGRSDAPPDPGRIEAAARQAGAAASIERLPRRYETRLGRQFLGGHELSGGQWQRLALARAFYRGGDFLVMDEPTAALDPRAEFELFEQMRELAHGKSVLLISHRFANVRTADRIYVLDAGRVVEHGNHAELMENDGLYAELFRLQASSYTDQP